MTIKAFAPANISCIFQIHKGTSPENTGSTGVGFTLNKGITVIVSQSNQNEVWFNNKKIDFPTVVSVIKKLSQEYVKIEIQSDFPLGCGFGMSGASALASAYAINELLGLGKNNLELANIAHHAEVENGTGLGDITNQYIGGCLLKTKPSYLFEAEKINLDTDVIYCKVFAELSTKSIIQNNEMLEKINRVGEECLEELSFWGAKRLQNPVETKRDSGQARMTLANILKISKQFAQESGLLQHKKVAQTISDIEQQGGHATMIMLGNAVVSDIPFAGSTQYQISSTSAHLV